jgi:hypothetical protein
MPRPLIVWARDADRSLERSRRRRRRAKKPERERRFTRGDASRTALFVLAFVLLAIVVALLLNAINHWLPWIS